MKESLRLIGFALVWILFGMLLSCFVVKCGERGKEKNLPIQSEETRRDTILLFDTIVKREPEAASIKNQGIARRRLPKAESFYGDSLFSYYSPDSLDPKRSLQRDSVDVEIPISQVAYRDSNYQAWVSGFEPRLDSIKIFKTDRIIEIERVIKEKRKHWHIGPTIGYGYTPEGFQPYIGVSLTYSIWGF